MYTKRQLLYLGLEERLLELREVQSQETPEEDALLDRMDRLWEEMSDKELMGLPEVRILRRRKT